MGSNHDRSVSVTVSMPEQFLDEVDEFWRAQGYKDRSDFMRESAREKMHGPETEDSGETESTTEAALPDGGSE